MKTLIYKFKEQLQEGVVFTIFSFDVACNIGVYRPSRNEYKLNFTINTKMKIYKTALINILIYVKYTDVIRVLTGVRVEREYERDGGKTKMNVIELGSNC